MPAPLNPKKVFTDEPYRSIVFLLSETKNLTNKEIKEKKTEGLTLKQIQYALMEDHCLNTVGKETHNFLDDRIQMLTNKGLLKKYKMKSIKRKKKLREKNKKNEKAEKAKVIRVNILSFLEKLANNVNAIYKDEDNKYKLQPDFYKEGIRLENKERFDFFPLDKIMFFPVEYPRYPKEMILGGHVIYGLSDEIYSNLFDDDDRGTIKNSLEKIESILKNIYDIKMKRLHEERDRRLKDFMESTKSDNIKEFLRKEGHLPYGMFYNGIALSEWDGVDILHSKTIFFYSFKYCTRFSAPIDEKTIIEGDEYVTYMKKWMDEMDEKEFCTRWSKNFFREDFGFSKSDIEEILQWGWDNRDLFEMCIPVEIAYSRYDKITDYQLINHTNNLK